MKFSTTTLTLTAVVLAAYSMAAPVLFKQDCPFTDANGRYSVRPCDSEQMADAKFDAQDNIDARQDDVNSAQKDYTRAVWAKTDQEGLADDREDVVDAQRALDAERTQSNNYLYDVQGGYIRQ